jgi:hypothetical protein
MANKLSNSDKANLGLLATMLKPTLTVVVGGRIMMPLGAIILKQ